ncbi:hypothetical protein IT414_02830 [bacterium]|nr:hypothetical protein [bacterium]
MVAKQRKARSLLIREKRAIDHMMVGVSFISPLTALPQVYEIFVNQRASGVSLVSWCLYLTLGVVSLLYGLVHKLRPIITTQLLWSIMDILIIVGIIMYGSGKKISLGYDQLLLVNNTGKAMAALSLILLLPAAYYGYRAYMPQRNMTR